MSGHFAPVYNPTSGANADAISHVKSELGRIGATIGKNFVEEVSIFQRRGKLIIAFEYAFGKIWAIDFRQAMRLLAQLPDAAGVESFWDAIMYQRVVRVPSVA